MLTFRNVKLDLEGYAGVRIRYGSKTLCIDVINVKECGYLLYTHHHLRHYPGDDIVESLGRDFLLISPMKGLRVKPGDTIKLSGITVNVVDAYEAGDRDSVVHPKGVGVGFLVMFEDGTAVYHMGDTDLIDEIKSLKERIHILLIPIGGDGVMEPEEAVEAVKSLRPTISIPIHYHDVKLFYKFRDMVQPYTQVINMKRR